MFSLKDGSGTADHPEIAKRFGPAGWFKAKKKAELQGRVSETTKIILTNRGETPAEQ